MTVKLALRLSTEVFAGAVTVTVVVPLPLVVLKTAHVVGLTKLHSKSVVMVNEVVPPLEGKLILCGDTVNVCCWLSWNARTLLVRVPAVMLIQTPLSAILVKEFAVTDTMVVPLGPDVGKTVKPLLLAIYA